MTNSNLVKYVLIFIVTATMVTACSSDDSAPPDSSEPPESSNPPDSTESPDPGGHMPGEKSSDINITARATKIEQIVGDYDREKQEATRNQTETKYQLDATDLGVPFRYNNRTYILFGDTWGGIDGDRDAIAYTTDTDLDQGLSLTFLHDANNLWKPVDIPDIDQGAFDVPMEGIGIDDKMYVYSTTDHSDSKTMGRSVLARSDNGGDSFDLLYSFSDLHFINLSVVKTKASKWKAIPQDQDKVLFIFGSGDYRKSDVYLAYQPVADIENADAVQYFAGIDDDGAPLWKSSEQKAIPLFDQKEVGELSVTYNHFIDRWIMLYNAGDPRGINMRTAEYPWGPWTSPKVIFDPDRDNGYGHFMHSLTDDDDLSDPGREDEWGGEYGPYQYPYFAKGDSTATNPKTTIYFNMSTWNPYTVVLMKAELERKE